MLAILSAPGAEPGRALHRAARRHTPAEGERETGVKNGRLIEFVDHQPATNDEVGVKRASGVTSGVQGVTIGMQAAGTRPRITAVDLKLCVEK
ncbi:hypothetical protein DPEC_G00089110 [Dallia pectoralis]|uniref:Uncharacterized protein n=1 Tax=Dallia pectoralis TaxID=75939 RepID=A0ACC2H1B8_DALPE|nr:hypothetical protein DPEC_G00089110 [Dallia pectoralis]